MVLFSSLEGQLRDEELKKKKQCSYSYLKIISTSLSAACSLLMSIF